jgi:catalase
VDAAGAVFGRHPGFRALHAKGSLFRGTFTASAQAAALTRAAHMQGAANPATFRFSNGSGNPSHPDGAPDLRGLAVKLYLPDGGRTDVVAVTTPRFPARAPEVFIELLEAQAAPWKLPLFFARHPEVLRAMPAILPTLRPIDSYATVPYYGLHAFKWIDVGGGQRYVRYTLVPEASGRRLAPWEARRRGRDYLQEEISARIERGPVRFTYEIQIATPGDPTADPSVPWPAARRRVAVGLFEITGPETERETGGDVLVFDPTRVTDGIEPTDDPVLNFRPLAYSESVARRTA